jgi:hypothetical protein
VGLGDLAALDGGQRPAGPGDTEHLLDRQRSVQGQVLPQVAEDAGDLHRAAGRDQLAGDQTQQGRLARAVGPDQPAAARTDGEAEPVEQHLTVGPGEPEVVDDDRVGHVGPTLRQAEEGESPRVGAGGGIPTRPTMRSAPVTDGDERPIPDG